MQKKAIKTTKLEDGEFRLSAETWEEILDLISGELRIDSNYERSYPSRDWFDPPEYASMDVDVSAKLTLEKLKETFELPENFTELLEDMFSNHDCLEYEDCEKVWTDFIEGVKDEVYSNVQAYTIESFSTSISIKDGVIYFSLEIDDYSFDENEFIEAGRPEPDPYDY